MTAGSWVRSSPVAAGLAAARSRLPAGALELACHAAVPVAVDAGLLHLLRINFFLDPPAVLPFEAEAALLLSPVFREVGEDLYEIDPTLRDALLASLVARFGPERPARVAVLLEQYTDQHPTWHTQPELEHAQRLTALNLVDPARAADWLAANRTSAGGPALTREWFIAMTGRLRPRTSLQERTAAALSATDTSSQQRRAVALAQLGELALLPGADVRSIALRLEQITRYEPPTLRDFASDILDTVKRLVPPPPRRPMVEESAGSYQDASFPQLYSIDPPTFDPVAAWARPGDLTVPIGTGPDGRPVLLDLRDRSEGGAGPHGLIVGATGSGKSELLRTLIMGLAVTHSPDELNILPIDFRSEATFAALGRLPHLAGLAMRLGDELSLVDRCNEVLAGEISRRQQPADRPRPRLLVVIDEFDALLATDPSLMATLATIGEIGAALGIHLLLASQRHLPGQLHGLDPHLGLRISLRTSSASQSQDVIGTPDASALPSGAGHGFLRTNATDLHRFRATYVSGTYPPPPPSWDDVLDPFGRPPSDTLLDVLVRAMDGRGGPVHQVWLPPLPKQLALGDLPADGVVIGEVDVPREHRRTPFTIDLSGGWGHVAIIGGRRSGKTTALLTVVTALTRTMRSYRVFCIGGALGSLIDLPVVVDVFEPWDDLVPTTIAALRRHPSPDTVLVVDGWNSVRQRYPDLGELLRDRQTVIVATDERWNRFDEADLADFGTVIELRLDEPETSEISARDARQLWRDEPGRALTGDGLRLQIALPIGELGGSHEAFVRELAATRVAESSRRVRLGTFDDGTEFAVDFTADPHLLVIGGGPEDRLTLRRAVERQVTGEIVGPEQAERVAGELRRATGGPDLWVITDGDLTALRDLLPDIRDPRLHLVVFAASYGSDPVVSRLTSLAVPVIVLTTDPGTAELLVAGRPPRRFALDQFRPPADWTEVSYTAEPFAALYGIDLSHFDPVQAWDTPGGLTVPIGTNADARAVLLNLRDQNDGGTGPHGIIVGAAGSGRKELIRTLMLGLAVTNSPAVVRILPVDLHGGDGFSGLEALPHLAGLVLGTGDQPSLVQRFEEAVRGEIDRRQDPSTGRQPRLFVIVDNFSELHAAQPAVINTLLSICRVGRSLGIHLILSTERLREGPLRGLDAHLTFRIALRTVTPAESTLVIGNPDASDLPAEPGHGWLLTRRDGRVHRFRARPFPTTVVPRMRGFGDGGHQIWLPPLPEVVALGDLPADGVTIGLVDLPREHRQAPLTVDLSGHVAIVGERGSGTTTALQTVVLALARRGEPCHVYCLGGGLNTIAGLPFVGGVFHRDDDRGLRRLVAFLKRRPAGEGPPVVVVVDNWRRVMRHCPEIRDLLFLGDHVRLVTTCPEWDGYRSDLASMDTLVELSLEDPTTSRFSVDDARRIQLSRPGHGQTDGRRRVQLAAPIREVGGNHHAYVGELADAWSGEWAPRVEPDLRLRIGVYEDDGSAAVLDFAQNPHLIIEGTGAVVERFLAVIADWADGYLFRGGAADVLDLRDILRSRQPSRTVSAQDLLMRTWWTGAEMWVVTGEVGPDAVGPMEPVLPFLPQAHDLGFHLVLARDSTQDEPSLAARQLADLGTPAVVFTDAAVTLDGRPVRLDVQRS
ncbi:FtsK/SpoIIIE domain-containing protein [Dactylosporangium sp. NPDC050588]|uniref:FtsK/SpoIIIE domain-containing protein n=1 Tax=Dactylosporangium sp. NPDC050588 TaxID=3157211 RepID=UPI0033EBB8B5